MQTSLPDSMLRTRETHLPTLRFTAPNDEDDLAAEDDEFDDDDLDEDEEFDDEFDEEDFEGEEDLDELEGSD